MKKKPTQTLKPHFQHIEDRLDTLYKKIGYRFTQTNLVTQALTHRSYNSKASYERIEFLGDSLLGVIIAEYLYHTHPTLDEGRLTRLRATLVREESLVKIAEKLELYRHVILGTGERKGGGRHRASILADVVESLIAAIYLDSGSFETTKACVLLWYQELFASTPTDTVVKDAKSRLQEWLQSKKLPLPVYEVVQITGNSPDQIFTICCRVAKEGILPITETGESRRIAEQKCAELMINQLNLKANWLHRCLCAAAINMIDHQPFLAFELRNIIYAYQWHHQSIF